VVIVVEAKFIQMVQKVIIPFILLLSMNKILITEDDLNLRETIKYNLVKEGYEVAVAANGAEALEVARKEKPNLIILDIMLPKIDGFEVCRILRKEMSVPIIMLTARTDKTDKIVGLDVGADDYMTKPFSLRELLARVRALLRRTKISNPFKLDTFPRLDQS